MKTYSLFMKGCCMIAALLMVTPILGRTSSENLVFKARQQTNITRSLSRSQLTSSDTISLQGEGSIYALSIDAVIQQPREASSARIVLEDTEGQDYLVAESDRFRNDTTTVQLSEYCEETAQLRGITPRRLKCYLAGDAALSISNLHVSTEPPTRGDAFNEQKRAAMREAQVQDIVERINEYNIRHGKLWQAGVTPFSLKSIEEQGIQEGDAYITNMKYYVDGLYEIGERPTVRTNYQSPYVESFDWRDRHGKNWITSVKDQISNGPCAFFAAVGAVEALTNLFFNDTINLDLSEWFLHKYMPRDNYYGEYNKILDPLLFIKTDSVIDEESERYAVDSTIYLVRPIGEESIRIGDTILVKKEGLDFNHFLDSLKYHLIHHGPGVWGGVFNNNNYASHYMTLIGYGTAVSDMTYTILTNNGSYIGYPTGSLIGKPFWIFKNSFGDTQAHFMKIIFNDDSYYYDACFASTPVISRNMNNPDDIIIEDRDGDGYCNWGISENSPRPLPGWAHQEEDADDSKTYIGEYVDDYGHVGEHCYSGEWYITQTETISVDTFNYAEIYIEDGGMLIVNKELRCYPGAPVYVESGGTLKIDGGTLANINLIIYSGATLIIDHGGKLILMERDSHDPLEVPLGATMNILSGEIKNSDIIYSQ